MDGVLVFAGRMANTVCIEDIVALDHGCRIIVNEMMETGVPYILAAGNIRSGSPCRVVTAAGDGATAAITAKRLLKQMG